MLSGCTVSAYSRTKKFVGSGSSSKHLATLFVDNPTNIDVMWTCEQGCMGSEQKCWKGELICEETL